MNKLLEAAAEIQECLLHENIPFCFIGGIANIRWGEIRITNDIDLTVLTGFGDESEYQALPGVKLVTCSAEDLIITKAFANRTKDIQDIEGVIARQKNRLDIDYILSTFPPPRWIKKG